MCWLRYGLLFVRLLFEGIDFCVSRTPVWQLNDLNFLLRIPVFGSRYIDFSRNLSAKDLYADER